MALSESSRLTLAALLGGNAVGPTPMAQVLRAGPSIRKVADPVGDVQDFLDRLDDDNPASRRRVPNAWLQRQRGKLPGVTYRPCCLSLIADLDSRLPTLPASSRHTCPICGTTYEIHYGVRGE